MPTTDLSALRKQHSAILTSSGTKADKARALFAAGVTQKARISELLGGYSVGAIANALAVKGSPQPEQSRQQAPPRPQPQPAKATAPGNKSRIQYKVDAVMGRGIPSPVQANLLQSLLQAGLDINHPIYTVRFSRREENNLFLQHEHSLGHVGIGLSTKGKYWLGTYTETLSFNDSRNFFTQNISWDRYFHTIPQLVNFLKGTNSFGPNALREFIQPDIFDVLVGLYGTERVQRLKDQSISLVLGAESTHPHYRDVDERMPIIRVYMDLQSKGVDPGSYTFKDWRYEAGGEKGWRVWNNGVYITPKKPR